MKNEYEQKLQAVHKKLEPEFKKELIALLDKYGAEIYFEYDGDSHGIYDEQVTVAFLDPGIVDGRRYRYTEATMLAHGSCLSPYELEET